MSLNSNSAEVMRPPDSDIIQIPFTCGELGLPFRGIYRRNEAGVYVQERLERMAPVGNALDTCTDVAALDISLLRDETFTCPWCQSEPTDDMFYVRCGECSTLNCSSCYTALGDGRYNFCCASCGREANNIQFGHIKTLAVGEGGVTGELGGSVKKLQYVQA